MDNVCFKHDLIEEIKDMKVIIGCYGCIFKTLIYLATASIGYAGV